MSFFENITEKAKQYANIAADKATALAEAAADNRPAEHGHQDRAA